MERAEEPDEISLFYRCLARQFEREERAAECGAASPGFPARLPEPPQPGAVPRHFPVRTERSASGNSGGGKVYCKKVSRRNKPETAQKENRESEGEGWMQAHRLNHGAWGGGGGEGGIAERWSAFSRRVSLKVVALGFCNFHAVNAVAVFKSWKFFKRNG